VVEQKVSRLMLCKFGGYILCFHHNLLFLGPLSGPLNVRNRVSNPAVVSGSTDEVEDYDGEFTESADAKERISITVDWKV